MKVREVDVVVVGGGTAGAVAGIAAARNGAKTLIIEKQECLGGQFTAGMLGILVCFSDKEKAIVRGIPWEIREKMNKPNALVEDDVETDAYTIYDPEMAKTVLDDLAVDEPNLDVLLNATFVDVITEGRQLKGVIVQAGASAEQVVIWAKRVVDCSGDAHVAAKAGAPYELRSKKKLHPVTLMAKLGNVDVKRVQDYYKANPPELCPHTNPAWFKYKTFPGFSHWGLKDELNEITLPKHLEYLRNWVIEFTSSPNQGEMFVNTTGEIYVDCTDFEDLSRSTIASRRRIREALEAVKMAIPGYENAHIAVTASLLGVRETRRIQGEYKITFDDFRRARDFDDSIARTATAAGVHTADGTTIVMEALEPGKSLGIPYRCLVPQETDNLLVAGRCVSFEAEIADALRTMVQCMAMGEAAGTAAALSIRQGVVPRELNVDLLRKTLITNGACI